ncbi:uncharacterized protein LOC111362319 [Spodoptera litura]|uniref:Odorant receptor n=1 Tax=Spodoptera litura TaxID=69820 RepID=A0A9J7ETS4_SPOLT|nr:uncharacterized protein LOC111362319 [Spodoptera litura]
MTNQKDLYFDNIFKITTMALHISGSHPSIPKDLKWALKFTVLHGTFTLGFLMFMYNIVYHDFKENDFINICKNGVMGIVTIVITFQYCILLIHQDTLVVLIKNINADYEQLQNLPDKEKQFMYKYANLGAKVCWQWFVLTISAVLTFLVKSTGLMLYYCLINDFRYVPFYDIKYPEFIEERKNDNLPVYLSVYFLMFFFACYACMNYVAYVPLGPIFMLHASGQLELIKNQIDDLFSECDPEKIRMKLRDIIMKLQYIYSIVDDMKGVFKIGYEIALKGTALLLPVTIYAVLEAAKKGEVSMEFICFIIGGIMLCTSPCYYSDLLMEKGEAVRLSLYMCGWEQHYDRRTRTTLQLMLLRALRPIAIQTLFRTLCLDALTDLFQQSYGIFNLMNAMWN